MDLIKIVKYIDNVIVKIKLYFIGYAAKYIIIGKILLNNNKFLLCVVFYISFGFMRSKQGSFVTEGSWTIIAPPYPER